MEQHRNRFAEMRKLQEEGDDFGVCDIDYDVFNYQEVDKCSRRSSDELDLKPGKKENALSLVDTNWPDFMVRINKDSLSKYFERRTAVDINEVNNEGEAALHIAVRRNMVGAVSHLLNLGAEVNAVDYCLNTALHVAAKEQRTEIACILIHEKDAKLQLKNNENKTPLVVALDNNNSFVIAACLSIVINFSAELCERLTNAADENGRTALHYFAEHDNSTAVELSLEYGADISKIDCSAQSPLVTALLCESWDAAKMILDIRGEDAIAASRCDAIYKNYDIGTTFLHAMAPLITDSISQEAIDVLTRVFSHYGHIVVDFDGNTPLHQEFGNILLYVSTHWDINAQNYRGQTPLHMAIIRGDNEAVKCLLEHGADVNITDEQLNTSLHYWNDKLDIDMWNNATHHMLTTDQRNIFGEVSPLYWQQQPTEPAYYTDYLGNTELHAVAGFYNYRTKRNSITFNEIAKYVDGTHKGNDSEDFGRQNCFGLTPLHVLICRNVCLSEFLSKDFLEKVGQECMRKTDLQGRNVLHLLAIGGQTFHIDYLDNIDELASVHDIYSRTPLHYAALHNRCYCGDTQELLTCTHCLTRFGLANLRVTDKYGRTPMHYAYMSQHEISNAMLRYLEDKSCQIDHDMKDVYGFSPNQLYKVCKTISSVPQQHHIDCSSWTAIRDIQWGKCLKCPHAALKFKGRIKPWDMWNGVGGYNLLYADRNEFSEHLNKAVVEFMTRLAAQIGREDHRLQCDVLLVGSSFEGTKIEWPDEFDFNLRLTKLGKMCEVVTSCEYPDGFVVLRARPDITDGERESRKDMFSDDGTLNGAKVNFAFQVATAKVLSSGTFWNEEQFLEMGSKQDFSNIKPTTLFRKIELMTFRGINETPYNVKLCIDIVPVVQIVGWWPPDARPVNELSSDEDTRTLLFSEGCNLVFDQPYRKYRVPYSQTPYVKISFARAECILLRNGPPVVRAAVMVVKHLLSKFLIDFRYTDETENPAVSSHVLKTAAFWCIGEIGTFLQGTSISRGNLEILVRQILQCVYEFSLQDYVPLFFMPSFHVPVWKFEKFVGHTHELVRRTLGSYELCHVRDEASFKGSKFDMLRYSLVLSYTAYISVCRSQDTCIEWTYSDVNSKSTAAPSLHGFAEMWKTQTSLKEIVYSRTQ